MAKLKQLRSRVGAHLLWMAVLPASVQAENLLDVSFRLRSFGGFAVLAIGSAVMALIVAAISS